MQTPLSPLIAGLAIGVIWTIWHFPLHVTQFYGDGVMGFLFRFIYTVPFGVLFAWLYNRSSGNLFACILLHTSINVSSVMFGASIGLWGIMVMIVIVAAVVLADKMYRRQQHSSGG